MSRAAPSITGPSRAAAASRAVRLAEAVAVGIVLVLVGFLIGHASRANPPRPGAVDVGFAQDMATHHDQAVVMANLALTRGGPAVRGLADSILTDQSQEIGQLRGWLQQWGAPIADAHPMAWMGARAAMPGMSMDATAMTGDQTDVTAMPGMASPAELAQLYTLTGSRFDVMFLQLMIRHHEGGIEMAHYAELHAGLPTVRSAATAMRVEQVNDLALMRPLLSTDHASPLPAP